jgi:hypothetical protein
MNLRYQKLSKAKIVKYFLLYETTSHVEIWHCREISDDAKLLMLTLHVNDIFSVILTIGTSRRFSIYINMTEVVAKLRM